MVNGVGRSGAGGVAVMVECGEERRVRTGGNQECAAPSQGRQSLQPVPGTGGHQVVGKPFRPVPREPAGAAIGKKAKPGQPLMDRLVAGVAGKAVFVMQPGGDEIVQLDRGPVRSHWLGKAGPDQEPDLLSRRVRGGLPQVLEHGLGDRRPGRIDGQQLKTSLVLGTQPVQRAVHQDLDRARWRALGGAF